MTDHPSQHPQPNAGLASLTGRAAAGAACGPGYGLGAALIPAGASRRGAGWRAGGRYLSRLQHQVGWTGRCPAAASRTLPYCYVRILWHANVMTTIRAEEAGSPAAPGKPSPVMSK